VAAGEKEESLKEGDRVHFAVVLSEEGHPKAAGVKRPSGTTSIQEKASASQASIEEQVQMFANGCAAEYAFPPELSSDDRKLVKKAADRLGLPSQSLGMGSDRRIHIFRPPQSSTPEPQARLQKFAPVEYLVKNTFIDGPVDQEQPPVGPQSLSMPADTFQEVLAAEIVSSSVAINPLAKVDESPRTQSGTPAGEPSDSVREMYSFKNTFIHFEETNSKDNGDSRIIQSMPAGKFAEGLEEENAAAAAAAARMAKVVPSALCDQALDSEQAMDTFPQTPDADAARCQAFSFAAMNGFEWPPSSEAIVCPPAPFIAAPPAWQASTPPAMNVLQPTWPAMTDGTSVVVSGLTNQPGFNGLQGIISSFDVESGRYNVLLDMGPGKQRMAKLKRENLIPHGQPLIPDVAQPLAPLSLIPDVAQPLPPLPSQCRPRLMLDELVM
jgi:hypothetical protein